MCSRLNQKRKKECMELWCSTFQQGFWLFVKIPGSSFDFGSLSPFHLTKHLHFVSQLRALQSVILSCSWIGTLENLFRILFHVLTHCPNNKIMSLCNPSYSSVGTRMAGYTVYAHQGNNLHLPSSICGLQQGDEPRLTIFTTNSTYLHTIPIREQGPNESRRAWRRVGGVSHWWSIVDCWWVQNNGDKLGLNLVD